MFILHFCFQTDPRKRPSFNAIIKLLRKTRIIYLLSDYEGNVGRKRVINTCDYSFCYGVFGMADFTDIDKFIDGLSKYDTCKFENLLKQKQKAMMGKHIFKGNNIAK